MLFNVPRSFGRHDEGECYAIVLVDVLVVWREIFEMISGPFSQGGETGSGDKRRDNSSNDSYWYRRQNERQEEKERELTG